MNNKLVTGVLILWIASTWFAWYTSANDSTSWSVMITNWEIWEILEKTTEKLKENTGTKNGKRKWMRSLTDEEKLSLESMSDEEKKAFFTEKKAEKQAQREAYRNIVGKLIDNETITEEERATIQAKISEREARYAESGKTVDENSEKFQRKTVINKLLSGESLTTTEQTVLTEMKEKRAAREAIQPILEKKKNGEDLTDAETAELEAYKAEYPGKKWGKKGGKRWDREEKGQR